MNYSFLRLDIQTSLGPIENHFLAQSQRSQHLAILFPGAGYTTMGPMLYYSASALTQNGADVLAIEYPLSLRSATLGSEERNDLLAEVAQAVLEIGIAQNSYSRLTLVGKSMGTRALSSLVVPPNFKVVESIWLTPLLFDAQLVSKIPKLGNRQFLASGTGDKAHYNPGALSSLPSSVQTFVVTGADHGLDIEGDAIASAQVMVDLTSKISAFLEAVGVD